MGSVGAISATSGSSGGFCIGVLAPENFFLAKTWAKPTEFSPKFSLILDAVGRHFGIILWEMTP